MPRRRESGEQRERLLGAATRLLADRGIDRVNTNQVARAAGVGVGTLYAHFRDKHALLQAVVVRGLDALTRRIELREQAMTRDRPSARPPDAIQRVRALVEAAVDLAGEEPALFRVAFGPDAERVGLAPSARGIERGLRQLRATGRLDPGVDPAVAARAWLAAQAGVLRWWLAASTPAPREALVETLVRLHPAVALRPGGGPTDSAGIAQGPPIGTRT